MSLSKYIRERIVREVNKGSLRVFFAAGDLLFDLSGVEVLHDLDPQVEDDESLVGETGLTAIFMWFCVFKQVKLFLLGDSVRPVVDLVGSVLELQNSVPGCLVTLDAVEVVDLQLAATNVREW